MGSRRSSPLLSRSIVKYSEVNSKYFEPDSSIVRHYLTFSKTTTSHQAKVVIVGCGISGCIMALLLSQRGFSVDIFEQHPASLFTPSDTTPTNNNSRPSSSLPTHTILLSPRALCALSRAGVTLSAFSRVTHEVHHSCLETRRIPQPPDLICIRRDHLLNILVSKIRSQHSERISLHFEAQLLNVAPRPPPRVPQHEAVFACRTTVGLRTTQTVHVPFTLLLGCDGAFSRVRSEMFRLFPAAHSHATAEPSPVPLDLLCFVFPVPLAAAQALHLKPIEIHRWLGRASSVLVISACGSSVTEPAEVQFHAILYHPDIAALHGSDEVFVVVDRLMKDRFSDVHRAIRQATREGQPFADAKEITEMVVVSSSFLASGPIALLGDAAQTLSPQFPHGASMAIEDCLNFDQAILHSATLSDAVRNYQTGRCVDREAMMDIATDMASNPRPCASTFACCCMCCFCVDGCSDNVASRQLLESFAAPSLILMHHKSRVRHRRLLGVVLPILALIALIIIGFVTIFEIYDVRKER